MRLLSTGVDELVGNVLWRFYKRLEVMEDIAPDPWDPGPWDPAKGLRTNAFTGPGRWGIEKLRTRPSWISSEPRPESCGRVLPNLSS